MRCSRRNFLQKLGVVPLSFFGADYLARNVQATNIVQDPVQFSSIGEFEEYLFDLTNKIVGKYKHATGDKGYIYHRGKKLEYKEFACGINKWSDFEKFSMAWERTVDKYKQYIAMEFDGKVSKFDEPLTVYWRIKPKIERLPKMVPTDWPNGNIYEPRPYRYSFYTRFLIVKN
jgi:hypothetical protein